MSKKRGIHTAGGGVSLILLTFIILCLVSFAALSIVSARADARLTEKYMQQTRYYYGARNEAQNYLQSLDSQGQPVTAAVTRRFPAGNTLDLVVTVEPPAAGAEITAEGRPAAGGLRYRITEERTVSTVTYDYDNHLPVINN